MQHRGERRGLGGLFFDDLNDYDQEMLLSFATGKFLKSTIFLLCIFRKEKIVSQFNGFMLACRMCKFGDSCLHTHYREEKGYTIYRSA